MKALVVIVIDAGADGAEFLNEGRHFAQVHGVPDSDILIYDDDMLDNDQMRAAFYSDCADRAGQNYDLFAYFGHGGNKGSYPGGWLQLHFNQNPASPGYVPNMAAALSDCMSPNAVFMLYGCLAAAGPEKSKTAWSHNDAAWVTSGSFVQQFSAELCEVGIIGNVVIGHTTAGHTTENPMVLVVTDCGNSAFWHVEPYIGEGWEEWTDALHTFYDDTRFLFPAEYVTSAPPVPDNGGYDPYDPYDTDNYMKPVKYALIGGWVIAAGIAVWYLLRRN